MRLGKDLIGKLIISVNEGRTLGTVKDVYVNNELYWMTGIHLGSEGLIKRKSLLIPRESVVVFGIDAILVTETEVVKNEQELPDVEQWVRLSRLRGREVDTAGGTRVGTIGDIILGKEGHITGFSLGKVFIEGPVAEQGIVPREALVDPGDEDGVMTVDLAKIERLQQEQPEIEAMEDSEEEDIPEEQIATDET